MDIIGRIGLALIGYYSIYYFIFLIAQYYVLLPIIKKMMTHQIWGLVICGLISMAAISIVTYLNIVRGMHLPLCAYAGPFPVWLIFFALGCWLRFHDRDYNLLVPIIFMIVGLILSYIESEFLTINFSNGSNGLGIKPSVFFYSTFALTLLFSSKISGFYNTKIAKLHPGKVMEKIGRYSFTIYLMHMILLHRIKIFLPMLSTSWIVFWLSVLIISVLITWLLEKVMPNKLYKFIGL